MVTLSTLDPQNQHTDLTLLHHCELRKKFLERSFDSVAADLGRWLALLRSCWQCLDIAEGHRHELQVAPALTRCFAALLIYDPERRNGFPIQALPALAIFGYPKVLIVNSSVPAGLAFSQFQLVLTISRDELAYPRKEYRPRRSRQLETSLSV